MSTVVDTNVKRKDITVRSTASLVGPQIKPLCPSNRKPQRAVSSARQTRVSACSGFKSTKIETKVWRPLHATKFRAVAPAAAAFRFTGEAKLGGGYPAVKHGVKHDRPTFVLRYTLTHADRSVSLPFLSTHVRNKTRMLKSQLECQIHDLSLWKTKHRAMHTTHICSTTTIVKDR